MAIDRDLLEAALVGYKAQIDKLDATMAEIRLQLGQVAIPGVRASVSKGGGGQIPTPFKRKKGTMSAAARKRIAEAQKKRWAAFHAAKG